ncbi:hypothetical protein GW756_00140 [bacterium]|nr:hypothetical protein [bacterium]NCQ54766.1 hypothetical protein [Candidatus Parcubacteria bacterium]NCS68019.1 hypothetical protein [Candidatus Peregrinibacteria bacterium]NCS95756.1 hypothetical protein [bacterium]
MRWLGLLIALVVLTSVSLFWIFETPGYLKPTVVGKHQLYTYMNTGSGNLNTLVLVPKDKFLNEDVYDLESVIDRLEIGECLKVSYKNRLVVVRENWLCMKIKQNKKPSAEKVYKITEEGTFVCEDNCT